LEFFLSLNAITEETVLQPGSEVRVHLAAGESPPPTPTPPITYRVREGDSLWSIAATHNLTMAELLSWNGLAENALIRPGDELTIRQVPVTETPTAVPVTGTAELESADETALLLEVDMSPTPTPTSESASAPETLPVSSMALVRSQQTAEQPETGGPSGILVMAISLIVLAGVMLFVANRQ
jgi:LysM repeat protein